MKIETSTIDQLFLELSQFTSAKTHRENFYEVLLLQTCEALIEAKDFDVVECKIRMQAIADSIRIGIDSHEAIRRIR